MSKKIYRTALSFSLADRLEVTLGSAGINFPLTSEKDFNEFKQECGISESFSWIYNDPKYYENVSAKSIVPKAEDFIQVPMRLLSAGIVGAHSWKATDFSNEEVLRNSASKLNKKPVYKEHNPDLDNWVGIVSGTKWTPSFTQQVGDRMITVPAGIDGVLDIDAKTNPKLARGVLLGSIFSNSVTIVFDYTQSHPDMDEDTFLSSLGKVAPDGRMVTRKVTAIYDYYETSLVFLGADPFAKAIKDGELAHIDVNHIRQEFSRRNPEFTETETEDKNAKKYSIGFELSEGVLSLHRQTKEVEQNASQKNLKMDKLIATFIALFGVHFNLKAGDTLTEEQLENHLKALTFETEEQRQKVAETAQELQKFKAALSEFSDIKAEDKAEEILKKVTFISVEDKKSLEGIEQLKADAEFGKTALTNQRNEAIRLYKIAAGDQKSDAVINMMLKANTEELEGLLALHTNGATSKFKATCKGCGKSEFTFQSSFTGETDGDDTSDTTAPISLVTVEDIRNQFPTRTRR